MKNLFEVAVLAVAAWLLLKFASSAPSAAAGGPSIWQGISDAILPPNGDGGYTWWDELTGTYVRRNNPATGNPIPDATLYPGDPGGWYNA